MILLAGENKPKTAFDKLDELSNKLDEIGIAVNNLNRDTNRSNTASNTNDNDLKERLNSINESNRRKQIILASRKYDVYTRGNESFNKNKKLSILLNGIMIFSIILVSIVSSFGNKLYTTFTFFEDLWIFFVFVMFFRSFKFERIYENFKHSQNSSYNFEYHDIDNVYIISKKKISYKIFYVLFYVGIVCNIINLIICYNGALSIVSIILELGVGVLAFFANRCYDDLDFDYDGLWYRYNDEFSIIFIYWLQKFYTQEEYENVFKDKLVESETKG